MGDGGEAVDGLAADAVGGGVGVVEVWVLVLKRSEFGEEAIELGIGNGGRVEDVVVVVGAIELRAEVRDALGR